MSYEIIQRVAAEQLGRTGKLRIEKRVGVDHLVTGQHQAKLVNMEGTDWIQISWIGVFGHSLYILYVDPETLEPPTAPDERYFAVVTEHRLYAEPIPADFELSDAMRTVAERCQPDD